MQIIRSRTLYDVCIVGSGAGGGMAAKVLTESGANVVMLEAGPMWNPSSESYMFKWTYDSPRRGAATEKQQFGEFDAAFGGWTLEGEPYTNGTGSQFDWFRSRMLGGRTNHWGRISLRFGPDDFRRKSLDGLGDDWPITYEDMKPFYDRVDSLVGIFGSKEGLPNDPDGVFLPPPKPRCYELLIKQAADRLKITCIASRLSILTQPLNGRMACHYCGQCGRGCAQHSNFSSPSVLIPPAMATKKLTIVANAMAREVTVDETGKRDGRRLHRQEHRTREPRAGAHRRARGERLRVGAHPPQLEVVEVSAGARQLDRQRRQVPDRHDRPQRAGLHPQADERRAPQRGRRRRHARLHAVVGRQQEARLPARLPHRAGRRPRHAVVRVHGRRAQSRPRRGGDRGRRRPGRGYGKSLKDDYRRFYGATVGFAGRGEMIPNKDSYMEIDPSVVDKWGIPVPRFHFKFYDYEINQAKHMQETFRAHHRRDGRHADDARCRRASGSTAWHPAGASSTSSA